MVQDFLVQIRFLYLFLFLNYMKVCFLYICFISLIIVQINPKIQCRFLFLLFHKLVGSTHLYFFCSGALKSISKWGWRHIEIQSCTKCDLYVSFIFILLLIQFSYLIPFLWLHTYLWPNTQKNYNKYIYLYIYFFFFFKRTYMYFIIYWIYFTRCLITFLNLILIYKQIYFKINLVYSVLV